MVPKTEKFFIFSWKELTVIGLLFLISVGFFFTLGLHYGKKLSSAAPGHVVQATEEAAVHVDPPQAEDPLPPKETLEHASKSSDPVTDQSIEKATTEAIEQSQLKVEVERPISLPTQKKSEPSSSREQDGVSGSFAIQLGSFPNKVEASARVAVLKKKGLSPSVKSAVVRGQIRYRVILTGFKTKSQAESRAKELKQKDKIDSFVVIKAD